MTIPAPAGNAIGGISNALLVQTQLPFFINPLDPFANLAIVLALCRNRPLRGGGTPAEGQGASPGSFSWAAKKGSGTFCRDGPEGASHKRCLTPFSRLAARLTMKGQHMTQLKSSQWEHAS